MNNISGPKKHKNISNNKSIIRINDDENTQTLIEEADAKNEMQKLLAKKNKKRKSK